VNKISEKLVLVGFNPDLVIVSSPNYRDLLQSLYRLSIF